MPTAYLFCPAYPLRDGEQMDAAVAVAAAFARSIAHELVVSPDLGRWGASGQWHDAASRRADFVRALDHDALISARGGYGCVDLLETLAGHRGRLPPLIGYSDLTILHAIWRQRGRESLYGFMPAATPGPRASASASELLRGGGSTWTSEACPDVRVLRRGTASGPVFAACLRVLASLCGTAALPPLDGCILACEDIDERPYQIDRDLGQLQLAGALGGVVGLVFGAFRSRAPEGYAGPDAAEVCRRWAERLCVPCIQGFPFGHEDDPIALACGRPARLTVGGDAWTFANAERRT
jgi:muramoyltetrapeptide carboxypeptidase